MFEEEYRLEFFEEKDYIRKECRECGSYFWTLDVDQEHCQDAPCVEYGFINDPPFDREITVSEMREYFLTFFEERDHTRVERYPVVARWRNDVFLVHASIYDFQPHVTSGLVPPPANPLVVSQPCIRLPDLDEVGKTGKHLTSFEMMGHHSFNSEENFVYWKEETVKFCHEMLLEMGVPEEEIIYKEHPWIGGGNAGPSLEVNVRGLELATLVFMNMERDEDGDVEIDGERYSPLDLNVVDTGYGLERWVWMSDGSPTIYDSLYPDIVQMVCKSAGVKHDLDDPDYKKLLEEYTKLAGAMDSDYQDEVLIDELMERVGAFDRGWIEKQMEKLGSVYTIADHARTIAFMLTDGVVPSNVEEGYLTRMVIRRALRQMGRLGVDRPLHDLVAAQLKKFDDVIDKSKKDLVFDMLDSEVERYRETLERGKRLIERELDSISGDKISLDKLIEYYDTHGIHPTVVKEVAKDHDVQVEIPDNFNAILAEMHSAPSLEAESVKAKGWDLPDTELLFYDAESQREFDARVIWSEEGEVVLDRTIFYPEGGGQLTDKGLLQVEGKEFQVTNVRREDEVVIHEIDGEIRVGKRVHGVVDWERRMALTRNHTATHLIMSSAREVLGSHIWQRGAHKDVDKARLDLSHHRRINREELKKIEKRANELVLEGIPVVKEELSRDEAESRFGFELYQGGVPTSEVIRVVHISDVRDYDAQACGGTHVDNTAEIGFIKILSSQRIQDGVERLVYSAGISALDHVQHQEDILRRTCDVFSVDPEELPSTAKRFFEEWKERGKELEKLKEYRSIAVADSLLPGEVEDDIEFVIAELDMGTKEMLATAEKISQENGRVVLFASRKEGVNLVFSRSGDVDVNMVDILRESAKLIQGGGGGTPRTAQGGGSDPSKIDEALKKGKELVLEG